MPSLFWLYWLAAFLIVVSALAILCAIRERWLWGKDNMTAEDRMKDAWRKILICAVILILALVLGIAKAFSHDHARPGLDGWYQSLRSGKGPCCDGPGVDATHLSDADWESRDGHYRVRIEGEWIDVPDEAVLDVPNRDGRTLVWPMWNDGKRTVRCFLPGAMI